MGCVVVRDRHLGAEGDSRTDTMRNAVSLQPSDRIVFYSDIEHTMTPRTTIET